MTLAGCQTQLGAYHREGYLRAAALLEPAGELCVFRFGSAVVPLVVRPLPDGSGNGFDAISPYDFSGPLLNGESVGDVWRALTAWARDRGVVTAFLRFHPLRSRVEYWRGLDGLMIVHSADNIVVDLSDTEKMFSAFKPQVERDRRVARRAGLVFTLDPVNAMRLDAFVPLYWESVGRLGASTYYRFPRAFFEALADELGAALMVASAVRDGELAASALILVEDTTAFYYLACSSNVGRKSCAMNMLVTETASRLSEMGVERFHLGGGSRSLRHFKERFGPGRVPHFVGQAVFEARRYAELTRGMSTDFFPAYRADLRSVYAREGRSRT